jgi:hypothetical protein
VLDKKIGVRFGVDSPGGSSGSESAACRNSWVNPMTHTTQKKIIMVQLPNRLAHLNLVPNNAKRFGLSG